MSGTYTVTFCGDTGLGGLFVPKVFGEDERRRLRDEPMSFFSGVKPIIEDSDCLILNLETCLTGDTSAALPDKGYIQGDNPADTLAVLRELNVSAVTLANNHAADFGVNALVSGAEFLRSGGIAAFGAGIDAAKAAVPFVFTVFGRNFYVFSGMNKSRQYTEKYGFFAGADKAGINSVESVAEQVRQTRAVDKDGVIVACPHWQGIDYQSQLKPKFEQNCRDIADAGADYIICHGTHIYGKIHKYNGCVIFDSIGNFVFNTRGRYRMTEQMPLGYVVKLIFTENVGKPEVRAYPIFINNRKTLFNVRPANAGELNTVDLRGYTVNEENSLYYITPEIRAESPLKSIKIPDYRLFAPVIGMKENVYGGGKVDNHRLYCEEFAKRGYKASKVRRYTVVNLNGVPFCLYTSETSLLSRNATAVTGDKHITKKFLKIAGIAYAEGRVFKDTQKAEAYEYSRRFKSCVLKPADGNCGRGISVGVSGQEEFDIAFDVARAETGGKILVEECFENAVDARYIVIGNKCVHVNMHIPPHVVGNGVDTVEELIEKRNNIRRCNPYLYKELIELDNYRLAMIKSQGYSLESVPGDGCLVVIDLKANLATGADCIAVTDKVHPKFKEIAERVSKMVYGLDVIGVDILALDHTKEPDFNNYIVAEVNTRPGISGTAYPTYGEPRGDLISLIVDNVLENLGLKK